MTHKLATLATVTAALLLTAASPPDRPVYDLVVRGGMMLDGTGASARLADVAVSAGHIVAVGTVAVRGRREIDARGRYVAPGFIDMMDQSGEALLTPGAGENKLRQGITTLFAGEGGTPVAADQLAGYFDRLERQGIGLNFGTSYSIEQPRRAAMGDKAGDASPAQLAKMQAEVATAMKAGAWGVTSALIYPPMSYMSSAEVTALAKPAGACGGFYSTHMRDESSRLLDAIDEAIAIGENSGAKVEIYHLKNAWAPLWGKQMATALARIAAARARGVDVAADMYVYQAGGTGLDITVPNWVWADGFDKGRERLKDPAVRARLKQETAAGPQPGWTNLVYAAGGWNRVMLANAFNPHYDKYRFQYFDAIGRAEGRDPADVAWDIIGAAKATDRPVALYFMIAEEDIRTALAEPFVSIGSDAAATLHYGEFDALGLPHPRAYANAVRAIAEYAKRRPVMSLEAAVHKMTGWPAERMGLADRGQIKPGDWADLVVFDYDRLDDVADYPHPTAPPRGVETVIVNGQVALDGGGVTPARAGRVLRHQCAAR